MLFSCTIPKFQSLIIIQLHVDFSKAFFILFFFKSSAIKGIQVFEGS